MDDEQDFTTLLSHGQTAPFLLHGAEATAPGVTSLSRHAAIRHALRAAVGLPLSPTPDPNTSPPTTTTTTTAHPDPDSGAWRAASVDAARKITSGIAQGVAWDRSRARASMRAFAPEAGLGDGDLERVQAAQAERRRKVVAVEGGLDGAASTALRQELDAWLVREEAELGRAVKVVRSLRASRSKGEQSLDALRRRSKSLRPEAAAELARASVAAAAAAEAVGEDIDFSTLRRSTSSRHSIGENARAEDLGLRARQGSASALERTSYRFLEVDGEMLYLTELQRGEQQQHHRQQQQQQQQQQTLQPPRRRPSAPSFTREGSERALPPEPDAPSSSPADDEPSADPAPESPQTPEKTSVPVSGVSAAIRNISALSSFNLGTSTADASTDDALLRKPSRKSSRTVRFSE